MPTPSASRLHNVADGTDSSKLMVVNSDGSINARSAPSPASTGAAPSAFTATTSTVVFPANSNRKLFTVYNGSDKDLYLMLAAAPVSASSYHVKVASGGFFASTDYAGQIRGIMSATITSGEVNPGEFT